MSEVFYIDQVEPEPLRAAIVPGAYEFTLRDDINPQAIKHVGALVGTLGKGRSDEQTLEQLGTLAPALMAFLRSALVPEDAEELEAHVEGAGGRPTLGVRRMIALVMWAVQNVVAGMGDEEEDEGDEEEDAPEAPAGGAATPSASTSRMPRTSRARGSSPDGPSKPSGSRTSNRSSRRR